MTYNKYFLMLFTLQLLIQYVFMSICFVVSQYERNYMYTKKIYVSNGVKLCWVQTNFSAPWGQIAFLLYIMLGAK
jgi:hypothetical protein